MGMNKMGIYFTDFAMKVCRDAELLIKTAAAFMRQAIALGGDNGVVRNLQAGLILRNPTKRGLNLVNAFAWARTKVSLMANSSVRKISTRLDGWFGMEAGDRRLDRPPYEASHLVKHSGSLAWRQNFAHRRIDST